MEDSSQLKSVLRFYRQLDGSMTNHLSSTVSERLGATHIYDYIPVQQGWLVLSCATNVVYMASKVNPHITKEMELAVALLGD